MGNFFFGFQIIYPLFLLIGLGVFLRRRGVLTDLLESTLSHLVFYYALPAKLFGEIVSNPKGLNLEPSYLLYLVFGVVAAYFLSYALAQVLGLSKEERASFVQTAYRSNFIFIGFPILEMILGRVNVPEVILVNLVIIPLNNILAIFILAGCGPEEEDLALKDKIIQAFKNPVILASLLALVFLATPLALPKGVHKAITMLGQLSSPLGLLLIGSSLGKIGLFNFQPLAFLGALLKTVIFPLPLILIGLKLGYSETAMLVAFVLFASPCAVNNYILTKAMGADTSLVSAGLLYSCLLAIFSLPLMYTIATI